MPLEDVFAAQRARVKKQLAARTTAYRQRIKRVLEADFAVEVRGVTGGAPSSRFDDEDRRQVSTFALFGAW